MIVTGAYGWRCPCGFSTVTSRPAIEKSAAVACWTCKELHDTGGNFCPTCGKPLDRLDAPGAFVEGGDRAIAAASWRERLLEDELRTRWMERRQPKPPFPDDAKPLFPGGWTCSTPKVEAWEAWFREMYRRWRDERDEALADTGLVREVEEHIAPLVEERVAGTMDWQRKHRCPRCGDLALTFFGVPNPM